MKNKCEMKMSIKDGMGEHFFICEKPAKFILRTGKQLGDGMLVCGIHGRGRNKDILKRKENG